MNNKHSKIEVLAPCGDYDILIAAVHAGADACYIGGNSFGARAYATNFDEETIKQAVTYAHLHGVKVYLTVTCGNRSHYDSDEKRRLFGKAACAYRLIVNGVRISLRLCFRYGGRTRLD